MADMKQRIDKWSKTTYSEMLQTRTRSNRYQEAQAIETAKYVLNVQRIANKEMTGLTTNGLKKTEDEIGKFQYVRVFNCISKINDWTPMDMVYGTCYLALRDRNVKIKSLQLGISTNELIAKMCGRALRALPSYIREHDLRFNLELMVPSARFIQNEILDTVLHADIMMRLKDERYYFWSFVNTERSRSNFQDKFLGNRKGRVPDGNHVICPLSLGYCDDINGWKFYKKNEIDRIIQLINTPSPTLYNNVVQILSVDDLYFAKPRIIVKI
jgi:hypothetical protein